MNVCNNCGHNLCADCEVIKLEGNDVEFEKITIKWTCCQCGCEHIFKDKVIS
jgi:hypothetical protein